jgi:paraquat-inducible protein B
VTNYTLEENDTEIHAWVLIQPKYAHLVKKESQFYNVSGIKINANLSGIKVQTESIISVLAGGIAFYNPKLSPNSILATDGSFYLLYEDFEAAKVGIPIVLRFKNVDSLQENITQIKFQGHRVGHIGEFSYNKKNNEIVVLAHIDPLLENALRENTQFWLVKPSLNLLNISGLDAVLSGNYIQIRPALKGKNQREFLVFESAPPLAITVPGLHLIIETDVLGSIEKGSPIYFKNIPVGNIEGFTLTDDYQKIQLKAFIKPEFAHLVKKSSHFYNVSGIHISGGLSGITIKTESLTALIKGGISFDIPPLNENQNPSNNGDHFQLYKDFDDAKAGIMVSLIFDTAIGLSEGVTQIIYKGIVLGHVLKIIANKGQQTVTARVLLDPITADVLLKDTQFWMVKPKISIAEVENLDALIQGNYITFRIGSSHEKQTTFTVTQSKPPYNHTYPGLHLKLTSAELGSISVGAPIMYHHIKIGDVQDYELAEDRNNINILIHIWPQYMDLIHSKSRFYNASGFQIAASLAGLQVHTESIESIVRGGISLYNPQQKKSTRPIKNGTFFNLFKDYDAAQANAFYVKVQFKQTKGLVVGSQVNYKGISVGRIDNIELSKKNSAFIWVTLELNSSLKSILGKPSLFWINNIKLGLARIENVGTLFKGSSLSVQPKKGKRSQFFIGLEEKPLIEFSHLGFNVSLTASRLGSIKIGDPVYYRQIQVGTVLGYELAETADQILIHLTIRPRFKSLIRENSQFWHTSGVAVDFSLFGISKIRAESLESILAGGISFATPDNGHMGEVLASGSFFVLHDEPQSQWAKWNPIIYLEKETQQGN